MGGGQGHRKKGRASSFFCKVVWASLILRGDHSRGGAAGQRFTAKLARGCGRGLLLLTRLLRLEPASPAPG